jgi:endonuclease V-like protein UPF0215 family
MTMKSGIRILAIDDSKFNRGDKSVLVVGVVERLGIVEGVLSCRVEADGNNATSKISRMISGSRFREQLRLIAINGTTVAGTNVVDITKIHSRFGLPVIAVTRKRPHPRMLRASINAAKKKGYAEKAAIIDKISKVSDINRVSGFYLQSVGAVGSVVAKHIENAVGALRLAHIIAGGVSRGESRGRL